MSLPLKDFRLGISESIDIALEAQAAAFGRDKAAVAREVLQEEWKTYRFVDVSMSWQCKYCGHQADAEVSCCYEHWQEAADAKCGGFWFIGSAVLIAFSIAAIIIWSMG